MSFLENIKLPAWFNGDADGLEPHTVLMRVVSSLVVVAFLVTLRWLTARAIRRQEKMPKEMRRRLLVQLRNGTVLLVLAGIALVWAAELRALAVYFFAIAVATVIATKELIQCVTGSVMRAAAGAFTIGDRIEVGEFRGDVIDMGLLTTTVLEIGPDDLTHRLTGRAVILPNSIFLSEPVINESFTEKFVLHVFSLPMKTSDDWQQAEQDLLAAALEQCEPYLSDARAHFDELGSREGLVVLSVDPYVTVRVAKADEVELVVRLAVPVRKRGQVEQAVIRRFLEKAAVRAEQRAKAESTGAATDERPGSSD